MDINYTVNILSKYYELYEKWTTIYLKKNLLFCNCFEVFTNEQYSPSMPLINYLERQRHYSGYGGSHRTINLDRAESVLDSMLSDGCKLPDNRKIYLLDGLINIEDNNSDDSILVCIPITTTLDLHFLLCYDNHVAIPVITDLTVAIKNCHYILNETLAMVIVCRVSKINCYSVIMGNGKSMIHSGDYTPQYLLAFKPSGYH